LSLGEAGIDELLCELAAGAAPGPDAPEFFQLTYFMYATIDGVVDLAVGNGAAETDEHGISTSLMRAI